MTPSKKNARSISIIIILIAVVITIFIANRFIGFTPTGKYTTGPGTTIDFPDPSDTDIGSYGTGGSSSTVTIPEPEEPVPSSSSSTLPDNCATNPCPAANPVCCDNPDGD